MLEELESLLSDVGNVIETEKESFSVRCNSDVDVGLQDQASSADEVTSQPCFSRQDYSVFTYISNSLLFFF